MRKTLLLASIVGIVALFVLSPVCIFAQPYVDGPNPAVNETQVPVDSNVTFHLKDDSADITISSIKVTVQREGDGSAATIIEKGVGIVTGASLDTTNVRDIIVSYDPSDEDAYRFSYGQLVTVGVEAGDLASETLSYEYSFTIETTNARVNHTTDGDQFNSRMVMDHSGKNVYVVWQDEDGRIWFSSSTDKGKTFSDEIQVSPDKSGINENPALAMDEPGNIYIIWQSKTDPASSELYFCRKLKNAQDFEVAVIPVDTARGVISDQWYPAIQAKSNNSVFITWVNRNNDDGVFYSQSERDNGSSFWNIRSSKVYRVDDGTKTLPQYPDIGIDASGHNKIITWSAGPDGARNIYFNALDNKDVRIYE